MPGTRCQPGFAWRLLILESDQQGICTTLHVETLKTLKQFVQALTVSNWTPVIFPGAIRSRASCYLSLLASVRESVRAGSASPLCHHIHLQHSPIPEKPASETVVCAWLCPSLPLPRIPVNLKASLSGDLSALGMTISG